VDVASARIEQLAAEWPTHQPLIDARRAKYAHRISHFGQLAPEKTDQRDRPGTGQPSMNCWNTGRSAVR
jgi:hypothetical protein